MLYAGIEWDEGNREKCRKHGITPEEIQEVFTNGTVRVFPDMAHSDREQRFLAIGITTAERHALIVFTPRRRPGGTFIRPISARYMHRKEVDHYEKDHPGAHNRR